MPYGKFQLSLLTAASFSNIYVNAENVNVSEFFNTPGNGACRINRDGSGNGVKKVDFINRELQPGKCAEFCYQDKYCQGYEVKVDGSNHCEIWYTYPSGYSSGTTNECFIKKKKPESRPSNPLPNPNSNQPKSTTEMLDHNTYCNNYGDGNSVQELNNMRSALHFKESPYGLHPTVKTMFAPLFTTHKLNFEDNEASLVNEDITNVIIVNHGNGKNVNAYFCAMINEYIPSKTLVIAPAYLSDSFTLKEWLGQPSAPIGHSLYWEYQYMAGRDNSGTYKSYATSFDVLDILVEKIQTLTHHHYPNIKTVNVYGFSAGAQITQMWSIFSPISNSFSSLSGLGNELEIKRTASSPSTWIYFDEYRPKEKSGCRVKDSKVSVVCKDFFVSATANNSCPDWNTFKYSTDKRKDSTAGKYVNKVYTELLLERRKNAYFTKDFHYLLAEKDYCQYGESGFKIASDCFKGDGSAITHSGTDNCESNYQGYHRYQRGTNYIGYLTNHLKVSAEHSTFIGYHEFDVSYRSDHTRNNVFGINNIKVTVPVSSSIPPASSSIPPASSSIPPASSSIPPTSSTSSSTTSSTPTTTTTVKVATNSAVSLILSTFLFSSTLLISKLF